MKDKSRFWFYLNYSLQICQHLNIFTAFDLKKKQKAEKFSKGHLDDWITGIFPSCARERSRDGFRHFSEKIHCQAFVEGWVAVICGRDVGWFSLLDRLLQNLWYLLWFSFSMIFPLCLQIKKCPVLAFDQLWWFLLAASRGAAATTTPASEIGLRWRISCIQNISLGNAPPPKLNETDKRHLWIEKDVHFINLGATYSKFLCSKMLGLLKNPLFWEKSRICLHIFLKKNHQFLYEMRHSGKNIWIELVEPPR